MVSSVEDYEYVFGENIDDDHPHGDMDRIIINGEIMPLRTGASETTGVEKKRILRGEDVVFLMEWARQRIASVDYAKAGATEVSIDFKTPYKTIERFLFTRRVSAAQMDGVDRPDIYNLSYELSASALFIDAAYLSDAVVAANGTALKAAFAFQTLAELGFAKPSFAAGGTLSLSSIESFFAAFADAQSLGVAHVAGKTIGDIAIKNDARRIKTETKDGDGEWQTTETDLDLGDSENYYYQTPLLYKHYRNFFPRSGSNTYKNEWWTYTPGVTLLEIHAPHAVKVVAVCAFGVESPHALDESGATIKKTIFVPIQMTEKSGKRFVLTSDTFDEAFVDELCEMYGETWENSYSFGGTYYIGNFNVSSWSVYPVVFFDDHTKIS